MEGHDGWFSPDSTSDSTETLTTDLRVAAKQPMTKQQVFDQRVSYVYGQLNQGNTMTKAQVARVLQDLERGRFL